MLIMVLSHIPKGTVTLLIAVENRRSPALFRRTSAVTTLRKPSPETIGDALHGSGGGHTEIGSERAHEEQENAGHDAVT